MTALAVAVVLLPVPSAGALAAAPDAAGTVTVDPSTEVVERVLPPSKGPSPLLRPGQTVTREVAVRNGSSQPRLVKFGVSHVVGASAEQQVEIRPGVREGAARWVRLDRVDLTLLPGKTARVRVKVVIPDDARPGSWPFAVTVTHSDLQVPGGEGATVQPVFRQHAIYIVELPGEAAVEGRLTVRIAEGRGFHFGNRLQLGGDKPVLEFLYENRGDRLLTPSGEIVVRGLRGGEAARYELAQQTAYPRGEVAGRVELDDLPRTGWFEVEAVLRAEDVTTVGRTGRFLRVPVWAAVVIPAAALLLVAAAGLYARRALRRRRTRRL